MKVGFIGLGTLGKEIVKRLLEAGINLVVWNRTKEKAQELGILVVNTSKELIKKVEKGFRNCI